MADKSVMQVEDGGTASKAAKLAKVAYSAKFTGAVATEGFLKSSVGDEISLTEVAHHLEVCIKKVNDGDMTGMEAMLVSQAHALQQVFVALTRRAGVQENAKPLAAYLNLALKAQAQSRATIQALTDLKYPRQIINRQTNIANGGPQQVNNGIPDPTRAGASENAAAQNELLEGDDGSAKMVVRTTPQAGRINKGLAAVGEIDRPQDPGRKAGSVKKRVQRRALEKGEGAT